MQRSRILDAMAEVAAHQGMRRATVRSVLKQARISSATFYVLFKDLDDCFLTLLGEVMSHSTRLMFEAFQRESSWPDGAAAGLAALLVSLDAEPARTRVCLTESLGAGTMALELRACMLRALEPLIDARQDQASLARVPLALTAEPTIASVVGILHNRLVSGDAPPFIDLLGELVSLVLGPGMDASSLTDRVEQAEQLAREISQQRLSFPVAPSTKTQIPKVLQHPLARRARACVLYLANHPGASNQTIGAAIAVTHQGQISTLLARLHDLGLLVKHAGAPGHPNAWSLTAEGNRIAQALEDY
jgi:AcrR family transcriptional regulator